MGLAVLYLGWPECAVTVLTGAEGFPPPLVLGRALGPSPSEAEGKVRLAAAMKLHELTLITL
jgi:hypothetical protein